MSCSVGFMSAMAMTGSHLSTTLGLLLLLTSASLSELLLLLLLLGSCATLPTWLGALLWDKLGESGEGGGNLAALLKGDSGACAPAGCSSPRVERGWVG